MTKIILFILKQSVKAIASIVSTRSLIFSDLTIPTFTVAKFFDYKNHLKETCVCFFNLSFSIAIHVMFYVTAVEYLLCVGMNTDMKDEALPWSAQPRTRERHRTRLCQ